MHYVNGARILLFEVGQAMGYLSTSYTTRRLFKPSQSYHEYKFGPEFKPFGERNKALKISDHTGFGYELGGPEALAVSYPGTTTMHTITNFITFVETPPDLEDIPHKRSGFGGES